MKKNTIEISTEKKGELRKGILTLESELTFANAKELLDNYMAKMDKFDTLVMQGNVELIDLTGIQALYSIRKSLKENKKTIAIGIKINEDTKNLVLRSGFKEIFETF
jgi:anti-anti-sigma regulatory factor